MEGVTGIAARPYVNRSAIVRDDLDTLTPVPTVSILGRLIKAGMVLVDPDLDTPVVEVDHRMRAQPGSGEAVFLVFDYDRGQWMEERFHSNSLVKVMARPTPV